MKWLSIVGFLERLYVIVYEYDPRCVCSLDETSFLIQLNPRYTMVLPSEDPTIIQVTLVVCCAFECLEYSFDLD